MHERVEKMGKKKNVRSLKTAQNLTAEATNHVPASAGLQGCKGEKATTPRVNFVSNSPHCFLMRSALKLVMLPMDDGSAALSTTGWNWDGAKRVGDTSDILYHLSFNNNPSNGTSSRTLSWDSCVQ
jgi:hypothetical protein